MARTGGHRRHLHGPALDELAAADYLVKLALAALAIAPYGALLTVMRRRDVHA
jgi:uncharacterized PurR-regulated membrane protein YhhQ (DUF165 family)